MRSSRLVIGGMFTVGMMGWEGGVTLVKQSVSPYMFNGLLGCVMESVVQFVRSFGEFGEC